MVTLYMAEIFLRYGWNLPDRFMYKSITFFLGNTYFFFYFTDSVLLTWRCLFLAIVGEWVEIETKTKFIQWIWVLIIWYFWVRYFSMAQPGNLMNINENLYLAGRWLNHALEIQPFFHLKNFMRKCFIVIWNYPGLLGTAFYEWLTNGELILKLRQSSEFYCCL